MKTLIHIALLCLPFIAFSQQEKAVDETVEGTDFTIGRHGADCSGRGLCSFNTNLNKAEAKSTLVYHKDRTATLSILRNKITKEEEAKIAGKPLSPDSEDNGLTFVMEDDLVLDTATKANLKLPSQLTKIAKGSYPIHLSKDKLTITFNLE